MQIKGVGKCDFNHIPWYMFMFTYYEVGYTVTPAPYLPGMPYDSQYKRGCVTVRASNDLEAILKADLLVPKYSTRTYMLEIPGLARKIWRSIKETFEIPEMPNHP